MNSAKNCKRYCSSKNGISHTPSGREVGAWTAPGVARRSARTVGRRLIRDRRSRRQRNYRRSKMQGRKEGNARGFSEAGRARCLPRAVCLHCSHRFTSRAAVLAEAGPILSRLPPILVDHFAPRNKKSICPRLGDAFVYADAASIISQTRCSRLGRSA